MAQVIVGAGGGIILDPGQVRNQEISSATGDQLQYFKVQHKLKPHTTFGTAIGGTPTAYEVPVYVADGAGVVLGFHGKLNAAGSSTSVTIDIKKNGTSISTGGTGITIGNTTAKIDGTVATATFAAGDVLSLAISGTFTGAQGPWACISLYETVTTTT